MTDIWLYPAGSGQSGGLLRLLQDEGQVEAGGAGDGVFLSLQFRAWRSHLWDAGERTGQTPTLWDLDGVLYLGDDDRRAGARLLPLDRPREFTTPTTEHRLELIFQMPRAYAQYLEETRPKGPGVHTISLNLRLTATLTIAAPALGRTFLERVESHQRRYSGGAAVAIAESRWAGAVLPAWQLPQRERIELPALDGAAMPEELRRAVEHVDAGWGLFRQGRYGEAVQRSRQAREALLSPNMATWCQEHLANVLGGEKTAMVSEGFKSLTHLGHAASHSRTPVEIDRPAAEYVLGLLTLLLHYLAQELR